MFRRKTLENVASDELTFGTKKNSKNSNVSKVQPESVYHDDFSVDSKMNKPSTPQIHEDILVGFNANKHDIKDLLRNNENSIDLDQESRPVREVFQATYGVCYNESVNEGGIANVQLRGDPYFESPGRNMRRSDLIIKQALEKDSRVEDY